MLLQQRLGFVWFQLHYLAEQTGRVWDFVFISFNVSMPRMSDSGEKVGRRC